MRIKWQDMWKKRWKTYEDDDFESGVGKIYGFCENKENPFLTFSSDRKPAIKFSKDEVSKIHFIEWKTKFSVNEQLKAAVFERKHCRITELNAGDYDDRMKMKEITREHYRHQLVHNFSASELNYGVWSVSENTKFCWNMLIHFPTTTVLQPHIMLMKEITNKYIKWTLDYGTDNRSDSIPMTLESDSDYGYLIDQTNLEQNLCARRTVWRRII